MEPSADTETNPNADFHGENAAINVEPLQKQPQKPPQEPLRKRLQRTHRLPTKYRQNTADISVYLTDKVTPFTESRRKKINELLEKNVFAIVNEADIP